MQKYRCRKGHVFFSPKKTETKCPICPLQATPVDYYPPVIEKSNPVFETPVFLKKPKKESLCSCGKKKSFVSKQCNECYWKSRRGMISRLHENKKKEMEPLPKLDPINESLLISKTEWKLMRKISVAKTNIRRWEKMIEQYKILNQKKEG